MLNYICNLSIYLKYSNDYRFGFNGQEKDNEIKGTGNSLDFGARIYDSRLGRWLSLDPLQKKYPSLSPYNFCANNPIIYVDADGRAFAIAGDLKMAKMDIHSIVNSKNRSKISISNDGVVKVDITGMSAASLNADAGLLLLSKLDNSKLNYQYKVSEVNDNGSPLSSGNGTIENKSIISHTYNKKLITNQNPSWEMMALFKGKL
jgi:RHS repeat-associated protein